MDTINSAWQLTAAAVSTRIHVLLYRPTTEIRLRHRSRGQKITVYACTVNVNRSHGIDGSGCYMRQITALGRSETSHTNNRSTNQLPVGLICSQRHLSNTTKPTRYVANSKQPQIKTRKLCYRKDDRAMRPIYGCRENLRDSLTTVSECRLSPQT